MSKFPLSLGQILCIMLGVIGIGVGGRIAYSGYQHREIFSKCLAGLPCKYNLNLLQLDAANAAARAELDMGALLAILGVGLIIFSIVFMRRVVSPQNPEGRVVTLSMDVSE
jgi:hypothetical protein